MDGNLIALIIIIICSVTSTAMLIAILATMPKKIQDNYSYDTRYDTRFSNRKENFKMTKSNNRTITGNMLVNLVYNSWSTLLQAGAYGSQVFLDTSDSKYLPYNYKETATGTSADYLNKKNLIETPNVSVLYNSMLIDFRAMANEEQDKITINLDMPNIDERYYIIQFCDVMGYDIIPLTPASGGVIQSSTAISSKSNTSKIKTWSVVSPLYQGIIDQYTCVMPSRQAYVMMRVEVSWDVNTGCNVPGNSGIAENIDYDKAKTFLNNINFIFPNGCRDSNPTNPNRVQNLKMFNAYYPNIATNGSSQNKIISFKTYNAQGLSNPLDPRSPTENLRDAFTAFVWYGANQMTNVPPWWDENLTTMGFYLANYKLRNTYFGLQLPSNNCPNQSNSNPCYSITKKQFAAYKATIIATLKIQEVITAKTGNLQPGNWISSATFTAWMSKSPSTDSHYYGERAYLMFDRTWIYIFANIPYDALYFNTSSLANGDLLNSANEYKLVLNASNWPTTAVSQGWWSLVSYDESDYYNNVDCKFTTGSAQMPAGFDTTKSYSKDVTILLTPNPQKYTNSSTQLVMGIPTTPTDFYLVFRVYSPSETIINNGWKPETIVLA